MNNIATLENILAGATCVEDIQSVVEACGGALDKKVLNDLITRAIKANPALRAKLQQAKDYSRIGRKLREEVKEEAKENLSISKYDLMRALSNAPGACSGSATLATGRRIAQDKEVVYVEKMRNITASLSRYRESLTQHGLLPEGSGCVYVASFQRDGNSFCKVGMSYDMEQRERALKAAYGPKLEIVRVFRTPEPSRMEAMLKERFSFARNQVQKFQSNTIHEDLTGHTEVMQGKYLQEVLAKAEALYLVLS